MACPRVGACSMRTPEDPTLSHTLLNLHLLFVELSGFHIHRIDRWREADLKSLDLSKICLSG